MAEEPARTEEDLSAYKEASKKNKGDASGAEQKQVYPREVEPVQLGDVEAVNERENELTDEANVEALEQTSRDYWGRSSQQTDGAVPIEPPDTDPLPVPPRKPKGPPEHNM